MAKEKKNKKKLKYEGENSQNNKYKWIKFWLQ